MANFLTFDVKRAFFDIQKIERAAERAKARVLNRSGATVRKIARRSIRFRKRKVSRPGDPPFAHVSSREFGIRTILYFYEPQNSAVIVGPVGRTSASSVPEALEFGGRSVTQLSRWQRRRTGRRTQTVTVRKRPFMAPALETFAREYPDLWKDSIQ